MTEEEKFLENIGNRIKELRIKAGYQSYEPFAYDHDIPRAQFGRYEAGENMKILSLYKVIKALGISHKDFFKTFDE